VIITWHLLSRGENYAFMRPALHAEKIRKLELAIGAPRQRGKKLAVRAFAPRSVKNAEREQAAEHQAAYARLTAGWQPSRPAKKVGAGATPGRASQGALEGQSRAAGHKSLTPALRFVGHPHPTEGSQIQDATST